MDLETTDLIKWVEPGNDDRTGGGGLGGLETGGNPEIIPSRVRGALPEIIQIGCVAAAAAAAAAAATSDVAVPVTCV